MISGLPGTGKSALARSLGVPVFAKDEVEATLRRSGITEGMGSGDAAYAALFVLARQMIRAAQTVVLDAVFGLESGRDAARELGGDGFRAIECICSDKSVHRSRLVGRTRNIPGWYELEWADVERSRARYEPWTGERLVLDDVEPLADNVGRAMSYFR